jgi:hypothetical protein
MTSLQWFDHLAAPLSRGREHLAAVVRSWTEGHSEALRPRRGGAPDLRGGSGTREGTVAPRIWVATEWRPT